MGARRGYASSISTFVSGLVQGKFRDEIFLGGESCNTPNFFIIFAFLIEHFYNEEIFYFALPKCEMVSI